MRRNRIGEYFSGVVCRDASCIMFKNLEIQKLGVIIVSKCNGKIEQKLVIAHVDDADLCASGENSEKNAGDSIVLCEDA